MTILGKINAVSNGNLGASGARLARPFFFARADVIKCKGEWDESKPRCCCCCCCDTLPSPWRTVGLRRWEMLPFSLYSTLRKHRARWEDSEGVAAGGTSCELPTTEATDEEEWHLTSPRGCGERLTDDTCWQKWNMTVEMSSVKLR